MKTEEKVAKLLAMYKPTVSFKNTPFQATTPSRRGASANVSLFDYDARPGDVIRDCYSDMGYDQKTLLAKTIEVNYQITKAVNSRTDHALSKYIDAFTTGVKEYLDKHPNCVEQDLTALKAKYNKQLKDEKKLPTPEEFERILTALCNSGAI